MQHHFVDIFMELGQTFLNISLYIQHAIDIFGIVINPD